MGARSWANNFERSNERKMQTGGVKKVGNLTLHRGGKYASPTSGAEIIHEREVRERFAALMRDERGRAVRERAIYNAAEGVTHPTRIITRLMRKMKRQRFTEDQIDASLILPLQKYKQALFHGQTGEHRPAA